MRKIQCWLSSGFVGSTRKAVIEVEYDATDDQIDEAVRDWMFNYVEFGWSDASADAEVTG